MSSLLSAEEKAVALYRGEALAPMVRASTTPLRTLALQYGADFCYTEELIDRSLTDTTRVVNSELNTIDYVKGTSKWSPKQQRRSLLATTDGTQQGGRRPTTLLLRIDPAVETGRLVCQIGTGDAEMALAAALHVHRDVSAIDVNMGCPKKFSVSGGMGSALLSDPERACRIVRTLTNAISSNHHGSGSSSSSSNPCIPVSAKIRLLKDTQSTLDFITALVNAGCKAIAIHGRQVGDAEVTAANWEELETVVSLATAKFPNTPILINGDFYTRDEFTDFRGKTGAAGVLLARPALYNTSLFRKPPLPLPSSATESSSSSSSITCLYGYNSLLLLDKTTVIQDYLQHAVRYDTHYKNIKYVVCEMMNSRRAPHARVPHLPQQFHHATIAAGGGGGGGGGGPKNKLTIGATCACSSLRDICQLWNVNYDNHCYGQGEVKLLEGGATVVDDTATASLAPGEHSYLDSYILKSTASEVLLVPAAAAAADPTHASKRARVNSP